MKVRRDSAELDTLTATPFSPAGRSAAAAFAVRRTVYCPPSFFLYTRPCFPDECLRLLFVHVTALDTRPCFPDECLRLLFDYVTVGARHRSRILGMFNSFNSRVISDALAIFSGKIHCVSHVSPSGCFLRETRSLL